MTKKSQARRMRDAQKKHEEQLAKAGGPDGMGSIPENNHWDDLQKLYQITAVALQLYCSQAAGFKDRASIGFLKQPDVFASNVRRLTSNLQLLITELAALKNEHIALTGPATTADQLIDSIRIMETYNLYNEKLRSLVGQDLQDIEEMLAAAVQRRAGVLHEAGLDNNGEELPSDAQDVNTITDVEIISETTKAN